MSVIVEEGRELTVVLYWSLCVFVLLLVTIELCLYAGVVISLDWAT